MNQMRSYTVLCASCAMVLWAIYSVVGSVVASLAGFRANAPAIIITIC